MIFFGLAKPFLSSLFVRLYQEPTDDEADHLDTPEKDYRMDPGTPVLSSDATMYPTVKIPIL